MEEDLIMRKSIEYADSKLDESSTISIHEQKKMECFDWADIADAFEAGVKWARENPEYEPMLVERFVEDDETQTGQPCELCPFQHITNKDCSLLFEKHFGKKCATFAVRFEHIAYVSKKVDDL